MKSEGKCECCGKTFSGSVMSRHLQGCADRKKQIELDKKEGSVFLVKASCEPFWAYFEVNASGTLKDIDSFLRDLWLECCGHLSSFTLGEDVYASSPQSEYGDKSMNACIDKVLSVGLTLIYEYDFGTTTTLGFKVIGIRNGKVKDIKVIARNNMPDFKCKCGKLAKEICSQCLDEGEGCLCDGCAKKHECGEEMLLPFVNSPRTGMCGYTG